MAKVTKTPSKTWKAIIRKRGWSTTIKTLRSKRDAQGWVRRTEDDMVRSAYIDRAPSESTTLKSALTRYLAEVSPTKSAGTQRRETVRAKPLFEMLGDYALVAITPDLLARYRDEQLALGKSNNRVRLDLALLSHLFRVAIKEWRMGLVYNPVAAVRKPAAGPGRSPGSVDGIRSRGRRGLAGRDASEGVSRARKLCPRTLHSLQYT
ncbi:MAG: hypothetical protein ABFS45_12505 [Pseudomonadota bacterium]